MHTSVVNLGPTSLSLAGIVLLAPGRPATIHMDGFHTGLRAHVDSSLNSSISGGLVERLATGTKEECDTASAAYRVPPAGVDIVVSAPAVVVSAAKVEATSLPGVFASGKGKVVEATLRPALVQTPTPPAPPAAISAPAAVVAPEAAPPVAEQVAELPAPPAAVVAPEAAPPVAEHVAELPVPPKAVEAFADVQGSLAKQGALLSKVTGKLAK